MFYAELNNIAYAQETSKPDYIQSFETEPVTQPDGSIAQKPILYERVPTGLPSLTCYKPILKSANINIPVLFACKGTTVTQAWEVWSDINMFLDFSTQSGKQFFTSGASDFYTEQAAIRNFCLNYLQNETTQSCVFTGHSMGSALSLETVVELVRDYNMIHRINSIQYYNPYLFPTTEAARYAFDQAKAGVALWHQYNIFHIINWDFASMFILNPNVGWGQSYYYDHVEDYSGQDMTGITTTKGFLERLGLTNTRQSYSNINNHLLSCWTTNMPTQVYESTTVDAINQTAVVSTYKEMPLPNYYRGNSDPRRLWLFKDDHNGSDLAVNIWHEDDAASASYANQNNFVVIQNYALNKEAYFAYQKDGNQFVSFPIVARWNDSNGVQMSVQTIYILQDSQVNGINRFVIGELATNTIEVFRINQGNWNSSSTYNGNLDGVSHGSTLLKETYEQFLTTKSNPLDDKYIRSLWRIDFGSVQPLTDHGRRATYLTGITQPTPFESMFGLGANSGITNFNTYLISKAAVFENNTADSTERFILLDTNKQMYAYPSIPATAPEGIQGYSAVPNDTEIFNISHTTSGGWNISNTQISTGNRLYKDISNDGAGSTFLWELVSGASPYNYAGMIQSDFPFTNTNLTVINNGDGYYQIYLMYGTAKLYFFVQQNPFSNSHSYNYGFLTLIAETNIDSTNIDATKFKIADNVATSSGIY